MATFEYAIAAGHNVPLVDLDNIEEIVPEGDVPFKPIQGYPYYDPGQFRVRGDGQVDLVGYATTQWLLSAITPAQYEYAREEWCSGGFSGPVTIYTRLGSMAYTRCNAILTLPKPTEMRWRLTGWEDVLFTFTRLKPLVEP